VEFIHPILNYKSKMMKKNSTILPFVIALLSLSAMSIKLTSQTAIGGNTPDGSAMLDVQSNNRGVLFPRMTTTERNGINNGAPAMGLIIFNITTQCLEINLGTTTASWQSIICPTPVVGALNCAETTLTGNLIPNAAASGVSVSVPYTGGNGIAYEGQTVNSTGVTGLMATLAPGTLASGAGSFSYTISGTPSGGGNANFALDIAGKTCTLSVSLCGAYVASGVWKAFSCYNLGAVGATTGADPFTPSWELNGDYYQWGTSTKAADGPSDATTPNDSAPATWNLTAAADGSWTDIPSPKGLQDPCPTGFRVPSKTQWIEVINPSNNVISNPPGASWSAAANNYSSGKLYGPGLFLPAAGIRNFNTGALLDRGFNGSYWSSTVQGGDAYDLNFDPPGIGLFGSNRTTGHSLRCVAE